VGSFSSRVEAVVETLVSEALDQHYLAQRAMQPILKT